MKLPDGSLRLDDGYYFGLGAFETIAVEENRPVFLKEHLERLAAAMDALGIVLKSGQNGDEFHLEGGRVTERMVKEWLSGHPISHGALKIVASAENLLFEERKNTYTEAQYRRGFTTAFSEVRRNSTSPFTYLKSLNYGDNILEKRRAKKAGIDEPVFLNERGEICEGAVTNIFFVKENGAVITPKLDCGLLPGIIRRVLLENEMAAEAVIRKEELASFREVFVTNSLMGIMPVKSLGGCELKERNVTEKLRGWLASFSAL